MNLVLLRKFFKHKLSLGEVLEVKKEEVLIVEEEEKMVEEGNGTKMTMKLISLVVEDKGEDMSVFLALNATIVTPFFFALPIDLMFQSMEFGPLTVQYMHKCSTT